MVTVVRSPLQDILELEIPETEIAVGSTTVKLPVAGVQLFESVTLYE
jgi:hypothetical protein